MSERANLSVSMLTIILACPALLTGAEPAPVAESTMLTVIGQAAGTTLKSEEEARLNAMRRAVEQACGTHINSMSRVKEYELSFDKVIAQSSGFARLAKVIQVDRAEGVTYVKAEIEVFPARFKRKWEELAMKYQAEGKPRCVMIIVEDDDTTDNKRARTNGTVQSELEGFFISKGIQMMDQPRGEDVRDRDLKLAAINNDVNKIASAGAAFKAEMVIMGRAEATPAGTTEIGGITLYKWQAVMTLRAVQTDSAQILMSRQYTQLKNTTGSTGGGVMALEELVKEKKGDILRDIGEAWRKRAFDHRTIQVSLRPIDYVQAVKLIEKINAMDGTVEARLREVTQGIADIEVDWKYKIDNLASRLGELELDGGAKIEIQERTGDRLMCKLVK